VKLSIPFNQRIFRGFRLFVVSALIEHQGRSLHLPLIVDTAASYLTVRPDVFDQLSVAPIRNIPIVTASERAAVPFGQIDSITVGGRCTARNVGTISISLPASLPAEGLLGASFLRNFLVSIDYDKGQLELTTR
jgi:predicted aspartyl protease